MSASTILIVGYKIINPIVDDIDELQGLIDLEDDDSDSKLLIACKSCGSGSTSIDNYEIYIAFDILDLSEDGLSKPTRKKLATFATMDLSSYTVPARYKEFLTAVGCGGKRSMNSMKCQLYSVTCVGDDRYVRY